MTDPTHINGLVSYVWGSIKTGSHRYAAFAKNSLGLFDTFLNFLNGKGNHSGWIDDPRWVKLVEI